MELLSCFTTEICTIVEYKSAVDNVGGVFCFALGKGRFIPGVILRHVVIADQKIAVVFDGIPCIPLHV